MQRSYRVFRVWIWEILAIALAIGLIVAIAVALALYNGKPTTDWNAHVNFNALLAVLSTILRGMLVVIVSQVISQRKWDWFRGSRARPLSDLQQFDSGSRGSFGALLLIPTVLRKDMVALFAAAVLLTSFLVGPFVQLASRTTPCSFPVPTVNASLPFAHYVPRQGGFDPFNYLTSGNLGTLSVDLIVATLSAVTSADGVENRISPSCGTGTCTFPGGDPEDPQAENLHDNDITTHSTVGVCNKCTDISSLISTKENTTQHTALYILPNGFNVTFSPGGSTVALINTTRDLTWLEDKLTPDPRVASRWAYANITFLATQGNSKQNAALCILYPCLRTYISSVTNNTLSERLVHSEVMQIDMLNQRNSSLMNPGDLALGENSASNSGYYYGTVKSPCRVKGQVYDVSTNMSSYSGGTKLALHDFTGQDVSAFTYKIITAPEQCIYRQNPQFVMATSKVFNRELFSGACSSYKGPNCIRSDRANAGYVADLGVGTVLRTLFNNGNVSCSNVTRWFDSFTNVMTNRFRFEYGASDFNASNTNLPLGEVHGMAWETKVCIQTHWQWLLLPICLTFVTAIVSIWTIASNWRHRHSMPVWKDSIMPFIFYGHKIESQESNLYYTSRRSIAGVEIVRMLPKKRLIC